MLDMDEYGHWGDFPCKGVLLDIGGHGYICEYAKI